MLLFIYIINRKKSLIVFKFYIRGEYMLTTHRNDFHNKNIYIDFENEDISPMLSFRAIAYNVGAPLQIMLEDKEAIMVMDAY